MMFSPKLRIVNTEYVPDAEDKAPGTPVTGEGNPNLIQGWNFPKDLGISRADVYPDKRAGKWTRRFMDRWIT